MKLNIRLLYLYLFSFVGLLVTVIGAIQLANLGLKTYVFPQADEMVTYPAMKSIVPLPEIGKNTATVSMEEQQKQEEEMQKVQKTQTARQHQREATGAFAMILIGLPLYAYHWHLAQKEKS
jgi:hypothetical protein